MIIIYAANHNNTGSDKTEAHITKALRELGHEVICVPQQKDLPEGDVLLFHKWIPPDFAGNKVCWWFDKIRWNNREKTMEEIIKKSDNVFITDETWLKECPNEKVKVLRQGVGEKRCGRYKTAPDVAFTGSLYGERYDWAKRLSERFKSQFKAYNDIFNDDLADLCASVKIFVAPKFPSDDYYWSNRVYEIIGRGGFLIHPYCEGLKEEFPDLPMYRDEEEMYEMIEHYLKDSEHREQLRLINHEACPTYKDRVKELLCQI